MNYPLISEYIEAVNSAEDNFEELSYLRPVLDDDGLPVMTSGNFAVVFKMKDEQSGKFYAVKCFTKKQEGRTEAYREIAKELENISSTYILSIRFLEKELFVDTDQTTETEFPVLLMDWVEGKTLDKYLRENLVTSMPLEMLAYRFSQLALWLIPQPFAHGDLKPDNILVREDGTLVLVDYDGMFVPAMKGQKARELGSPDFRHPLRNENDFDEHIDDFPLASILLSLKAISLNPQLLEEYGAADRLLFSERDYENVKDSLLTINLLGFLNSQVQQLLSSFMMVLLFKDLRHYPLDNSLSLNEPPIELVNDVYEESQKSNSQKAKRHPITPIFVNNFSKDTNNTFPNKKRNPLIHGLIPPKTTPNINIPNSITLNSKKPLSLHEDIELRMPSKYSPYGHFFMDEIDIPDKTIEIKNREYEGYVYVTQIRIPNSVTTIGSRAFYGCKSLSSIIIPKGVKEIGSWAFANCSSLFRITLPDSIEYIGEKAFNGCQSLKQIMIPIGTTKKYYTLFPIEIKKLLVTY